MINELEGYYREPTIHGDRIVFVCESDLWAGSVDGGRARRLTAHYVDPSSPAFSPDGKWLAFVGRDEGVSEVYVMPAAGGIARRLTFQGTHCMVLGWSADATRVEYASMAAHPYRRGYRLWSVPREGGPPEVSPLGPVERIAHGPGGGLVIGRNVGDPARWKRYRGGRAGDLWVDGDGSGAFTRLVELRGNLADPMWLGERIYFLSDHEGHGNLYSCTPGGEDLTRHTDHEQFYARNAKTDGERIVYQSGARIHVFEVASNQTRRVELEVASSKPQLTRHFASAAAYLEDADLHPKGHSLVLNARGKAFHMGNWEQAVTQLGERDGIRYRLTRWLRDGERLVTISDAAGEEALEVHTVAQTPAKARAPLRLSDLDIGRAVDVVVSPRADRLALTNQRFELLLIDLEGEQPTCTVLDRSEFGRVLGVAWSPDGRWLAYGFHGSSRTSHLRLVEPGRFLEGEGQVHELTKPVHVDYAPCFDPEGKHLYFISRRTFNPVYDRMYFDLGFPEAGRPYLITLKQDQLSPFRPAPKPLDGEEEEEEKKKKKREEGTTENTENTEKEKTEKSKKDKKKPKKDKKEQQGKGKKAKEKKGKGKGRGRGKGQKKKDKKKQDKKKKKDKKKNKGDDVEPVEIDLEGIERRIVRFPVEEGTYSDLVAIKGKVLYDRWPIEGSLERDWFADEVPAKGQLFSFDLETGKEELFVPSVSSFAVALDGKTLLYSAGRKLRVIKADAKPAEGEDKPGRESGWIDLGRPRISIVPAAEWRQMYREAWRLQRDNFWNPSMSEIDWEEVYRRYLPILERVATRTEFSDLMWEVQGELGTSHAYEFGGDHRYPPPHGPGALGADLTRKKGGWVFGHIVRGDCWDPQADSPLNEPGLDVREGDRLLAIDGHPLDDDAPQELLVNRAGIDVALTIQRGDEPPRVVVVKTLSGEHRARYREWVEQNRRRVHEATKGQVGYLHVPDMGPLGFSEFHRHYQLEIDRPGLIVDVRYNGGGHVSQLLLEKLSRRRVGYDVPRYGRPHPYPDDSVLGPIVCLTNEHAGSDGDIFSHCFKLYELGTLIGKRTWGGVVGIWPRHHLVDRTITTQAEFAFWFQDVGFGVENYGTEPDIDVDIAPQDWAAGRDPQLAKGIEVALTQLSERPVRVPEFGERPNLRAPRLS